MATIEFVRLESLASAFSVSEPLVLIGRKESVKAVDGIKRSAVLASLLDSVSPGDDGSTGSSLVQGEDGSVRHVSLGIVPEKISRSNSRARPHAVTKMCAKLVSFSETARRWLCCVVLEDAADAGAVACAIGRAFPLYLRKASQALHKECQVTVALFAVSGSPLDPSPALSVAVSSVRRAARLVDTPCDELSVDAFVAEARAVAERHPGCEMELVRGEDLIRRKFGLIWGVGKAATQGPALIVLSHHREEGGESAVLVGKGITYDTGGLALKPKDGMFGMKMDMGGAAALLCAFEAAVEVGDYGPYTSLHCVLCVAENAIGPEACRHDDVLVGFSGKTVEINNTDAEGRLVLADGVAFASSPGFSSKHAKGVGLVLEAATLTGAQMVATGRRVAAIVTNSEEAEARAVKAGLVSGDLAHPLPFIPEFHRAEFESNVADMKNSVKDRGNAQSSCAATFIYEHLHPKYSRDWLHLDIAGPACSAERATGFGVALVLAFLGVKPFTL